MKQITLVTFIVFQLTHVMAQTDVQSEESLFFRHCVGVTAVSSDLALINAQVELESQVNSGSICVNRGYSFVNNKRVKLKNICYGGPFQVLTSIASYPVGWFRAMACYGKIRARSFHYTE